MHRLSFKNDRNLLPRTVWYICAMIVRAVASFVVLLSLVQANSFGQVSGSSSKPAAGTAAAATQGASAQQTPNAQQSPAAQQSSSPSESETPSQSSTVKADCNGEPCEKQQPPFVVTLPPQPVQPWLLRERISWGATLVLALVGYVGIMLAISTLKKVERNTLLAETTAQAALDAATAALATAQAILLSERPWILVSIEPAINKPSSFTITATNKGRTPATITAMFEQVGIKSDEAHLPTSPEYEEQQESQPMIPVTLVPGESTPIKAFSRDDVPAICESEERLKRIENWDEKLFLHGRIIYRDLVAPNGSNEHETNWCCWYIHGRQKSGMVIAGPPGYNSHT
jgi:hypothetical protein